jgi:hypothetical protein
MGGSGFQSPVRRSGLGLGDCRVALGELLAAEDHHPARKDRRRQGCGRVTAARHREARQPVPAPVAPVVALDHVEVRPLVGAPSGDDDATLEDRRGNVVAAGRHRRALRPAALFDVIDLEAAELPGRRRRAAGRVEAPGDADDAEGAARGGRVGEALPAVAVGVVAVEAVRGAGAVGEAAEDVEVAAVGRDAGVVDRDRERLRLRPGVRGDVVDRHPARAGAPGHEAADDVDPIADPAGADLGALERAGREGLPLGVRRTAATRCRARAEPEGDRHCGQGCCGRPPAHTSIMAAPDLTSTSLQFL